MTLKLGMQHWVLKYYQVYSNEDAELILTYFMARSNLVPYAFVLEKGKTMDFSETTVWFESSNRWPKWQDVSVDIKTFCSLGTVCPLPRGCMPYTCIKAIHVLKHEKKCIKSDFKEISLKLATNGLSDKTFLLTSKFCPLWTVCPYPWAIYMYWIMKKKLYKIRLQRHFLKRATNEWSDKTFLLTSKLCPLWTVCPCPGAIYIYKIMKKIYKIRLQRDFFETCSKWLKWQCVPVDIKISSPRGCQPLPRSYIHV